jgi:hypothetical protein
LSGMIVTIPCAMLLTVPETFLASPDIAITFSPTWKSSAMAKLDLAI